MIPLLNSSCASLQKQNIESSSNDHVAAESPGSPANGLAERDIRARLLGTQSIGRVESSYLQALNAAEGQDGEQPDSPQLESSVQSHLDPAGH